MTDIPAGQAADTEQSKPQYPVKGFARCAKGLESLLADELQALGVPDARATVAGVYMGGTLVDFHRALIWSRVASRIEIELAAFEADSDEALYAHIQSIDWTEHLPERGTLAVEAHLRHAPIPHSHYAALRVKDAIVDQYRDKGLERPNINTSNPHLRLHLLWRKHQAILSVDISGGSMHERGYRRDQGMAPLKETLACAMLMRSGWLDLYQKGYGIIDPMCGSGTIIIEAALMAGDVAPGLLRDHLPPTRWLGFDDQAWRDAINQADACAEHGLEQLRHCFVGLDKSRKAITKTLENSKRAGVRAAMVVDAGLIEALERPDVAEHYLFVTNPPYDERLSADVLLYQTLGEVMRERFGDDHAALLIAKDSPVQALGLSPDKRYTLYNGSIECQLAVFSPIVRTLRGSGDYTLSDGAQMLANRLQKNAKKLKKWLKNDEVTCHRLYDADLPEYASAIDVYTEAAVPHRRFVHVQEYAPPAKVNPEDAKRRFRETLQAVGKTLDVPRAQVAVKQRQKHQRGGQYQRVSEKEHTLTVLEDGLTFEVNLFDRIDTGLYLDHRPTRKRIRELANGKRFLNLFAYTATATVHAASGGALSTVSVDLSKTYLTWATRNFALNGVTGAAHQLVQADVMRYLRESQDAFDLIFCDAPTFSNAKDIDDFDVQAQHDELIDLAMARLAPDGVLIFSNHLRKFVLDDDLSERYTVTVVGDASIPPDFARRKNIHHVFEIRHRNSQEDV